MLCSRFRLALPWALAFKGSSEVVALLGSLTSASPTDCSYLWMNPPIVTQTLFEELARYITRREEGGTMAIRLMNWLGAQGLGNGDRLCEERYWVGDGHNLRRSDGDANLLVSYLDARGTKAPWIAVKPTEPACLGHTSYIGHSRVEPNVRNSVCERGSRPERSLMTSKKVLIEECCRHLGCHMGIGIRNSCREAVLKLDVRQATH